MLQKLPNDWMSYGNGVKWRCQGPNFLCEVVNEGHFPVFVEKTLQKRIVEVRSFYAARMRNLGLMDASGYGIDVLVANAFTESSGCVPSPLNTPDLEKLLDQLPGTNLDGKLDHIARYVRNFSGTKGLVAFEPGYQNPVITPKRISMGAHHQLISTAAWLLKINGKPSAEQVREIVLRLPTDSKYAAGLAVVYFNKTFHQHQNQPPLMAACYNAGSLHETGKNIWNLRSTGNHIDRWIKYFNMSRSIARNTHSLTAKIPIGSKKTDSPVETILSPPSLKNVDNKSKFSVESVVNALIRKNYTVRMADDKNYNFNLVGIRNSDARVDYFDDTLFVFWKYQGKWFSRTYHITTYPGISYLREKAGNPRGTAILREGQYMNSHQIGFHNRSHPERQYQALRQTGQLTVYRDNNKNGRIELDPSTLQTSSGFAINIHRARGAGLSLNVGPYSAGCQVFASFEEWVDFNTLFNLRKVGWGDRFTYILINQKDV